MDAKVKMMPFCLDKITKMAFLEEKKKPSKRCRFVFKQQIPVPQDIVDLFLRRRTPSGK